MGVVDDVAAASVKKGMELFTYTIGDSMTDLSGNGTVANRGETPQLIVNMLSLTVDPFSLEFVRDWWGTSLIFFVMVAIAYICAGGGFAILSTISPQTVQRLNWIDGGTYTNHFQIKEWISKIVLTLVFPFLTYFGLYFILQLCYVVTALLATSALDGIPLTPENIVVYSFMALSYLLLSIIMSIRNIVIVVFCAGGLMLAALYLIPALQNLVKNIFMYFLLIVFMQPILIFVAAVGVMFITALPPNTIMQMSSLTALMILLLIIGLIIIFGYGTLSRMIREAL
jgi:hypothetical protein